MKLDIQTYVTEYLRNNIDAYGNQKNSINIGIGYRTGLQQRAIKMVHPMFLTRIMRRYGGKHTCLDNLFNQVVVNVSWGSDDIIVVDVRNKVDFSVGMVKHTHNLLSIVAENLSYMKIGLLSTSQKNVFSRDTLMKDHKSYFYFYIDVKQLESYSLYSDTGIITQKPNLDGVVVDFNNVSNMDFGMMAERIQCHAKRLLEEYESANAEINKWTKIRNEKSAEYQKFKKMFALD